MLTSLYWALSLYLLTLLLISPGSPYKAWSDKLTRTSSYCHCHSFGTSQSLSNWNPIPRPSEAKLSVSERLLSYHLFQPMFVQLRWYYIHAIFQRVQEYSRQDENKLRVRHSLFPIRSIWIIIASWSRGVSISQRATRRILPPWYAHRILIAPASMDVCYQCQHMNTTQCWHSFYDVHVLNPEHINHGAGSPETCSKLRRCKGLRPQERSITC